MGIEKHHIFLLHLLLLPLAFGLDVEQALPTTLKAY